MMEGWKDWEGKNIFLKTKSNRQYTGKVIRVESDGTLTWISIIDKFGANITFVHSEILMIEEER